MGKPCRPVGSLADWAQGQAEGVGVGGEGGGGWEVGAKPPDVVHKHT